MSLDAVERFKPGEKFMLKHSVMLAFGLVLGTMFDSPSVGAGTVGVRDNGNFFSDSATEGANRRISEIKTQFKKDLVVETFKTIPEEISQGVDLTDKSARNKMFEQWTVKEAKQQNVNGIYVLLSKEPAHLQIVVGNETQNKAFTLKDRDSLASLMLSKLRKNENDEALSECVKFVATTIASHPLPSTKVSNFTSPSATSSARASKTEQGIPWGWIITAIVGLFAMWLIVGVIRSLMGGRGASAGPGMMQGAGGGGMFNSLLGGMFGAAAGMWLYDQFSGNHGNAWGGEPENRGTESSGFSGQDTDYSGTGGDFGGSDSGGGDFGGGDFGGGDSGGGDF
jgi:uncharacterized membrane protein YgcG